MSSMNKRQGSTNSDFGHVLIFAGPHGAGKDTLEAQFASTHNDSVRIVRHITRPPAPGEIEGQDYYFIDEHRFLDMVARAVFIEHAKYIGVMSGTSYAEINEKRQQARFANITSNFEDGFTLYRKLGELGISRVCFFISPVSKAVIHEDPESYIVALRERLIHRSRPYDLIEGRLAKAVTYRELYLANEDEVVYVDNSDGHLEDASRMIARTASALVISPIDVEPA